jgi:hydrogenase expression/formation protein HypE
MAYFCPVPLPADENLISLAHGEGGRLTRQLVKNLIVSELGGSKLNRLDDAARLAKIEGQIAVSTDSFVVSPLFFPGGDIGKLAVYGTVNDLAVNGATPLYLTLSFILEEGLPVAILKRVIDSIRHAAQATRVEIVAGDTKVVPKGAVDQLFINTTGIGLLQEPLTPGPQHLQVGDAILVTGPIGRHGIAILCAREELAFEPPPESDCGSLLQATAQLRSRLGEHLRCMRDATRGGVAAVLHEWAEASELSIRVNEQTVPVSPVVRGACELLGLNPLHIANEGTMVVAVAPHAVQTALEVLAELPETAQSAVIGVVERKGFTAVSINSLLGTVQALDDPLGAPLPRIC